MNTVAVGCLKVVILGMVGYGKAVVPSAALFKSRFMA